MKKLFAGPVPLLFTLLFILFSAVILGDNITESLLISNFNTTVLPVMFIINACFLFLISIFFITLIDRMDRGMLMLKFLFLHLCCLFLFRLMISAGFAYAYPALYCYAYVTKIICFLVFWTIANDMISAREAKERFPLIAGGGVIGGVLVSFSVIFLLKIIETDNLILVWAGLILAALPLVWRIRSSSLTLLQTATALPARKGKAARVLGDFRIVRDEALLRNMAFIYFLIFILLFAHDYLFLSTLKATFLSGKAHFCQGVSDTMLSQAVAGAEVDKIILKKEIPRFLGLFKGLSNLTTFLVQLTVAGFFLRKLGTARAMLVMPLIFGLTFAGVIAVLGGAVSWPGPSGYPLFGSLLFSILCVSVALRVAAFDSVYSPNFQIFFSTLSKEIRGRGKIFLEGIIKPAAILLSGVLILSIFPKFLFQSVAVLLALSILLLWRCLAMKRVYSESIHRFLGGDRDQKLKKLLSMNMDEADDSVLDVIGERLDDPNAEIADFAFSCLIQRHDSRAVGMLWAVWNRAGEGRKARMLQILFQVGEARFDPFFLTALRASDPAVIAGGIRGAARGGRKDRLSLLLPFSRHAHPEVRAAGITAIWPLAGEEKRRELALALKDMAASHKAEEAGCGLQAAGGIADPGLLPVLEAAGKNPLVRGPAPDKGVRDAFLRAAGSLKIEACAKILLDFAEAADKDQIALIEQGLEGNLLGHPALLSASLFHEDIRVRRVCVSAVLRDRARISGEVREALRRLAEQEIQRLYRMAQYVHLLESGGMGGEAMMLSVIVDEHLVKADLGHVINIFRALAETDILSTVADRISSSSKHVRSSAVELLENNVEARLSRLFLPLCEEPDHAVLASTGTARWHFDSPQGYFILAELFRLKDRWVRAFALYTAAKLSERQGDPQILRALGVEREGLGRALEELVYG